MPFTPLYPFKLLIFISVISFSPLFAQEQYKPGTIIFPSGSKISGQISSLRSSHYVKFRSTVSREESLFSPQEIQGYSVGENQYRSKAFSYIEEYENHLDTLFLQVLVEGKITAYRLRTRRQQELFFVEKEGEIYQLRNTSKTIRIEGRSYLKDQKEYQDVLNKLLADGPRFDESDAYQESFLALYKELNRTTFIQAIYQYNRFFEEEGKAKILYKRERVRVYPGLRIGYNYAKLNAIGSSRNPFTYSPGLSVGAFVNVPFSSSNARLSAQVELLYQEKGSKDRNQELIEFNTFNLATLLKYTAAKGRVRPYFAPGVTAGLNNISSMRGRLTLGRIEMGGVLELGLNFPFQEHFFFMATRGEYTFISSNVAGSSIQLINFSLGVGF